VLEDKLLGQVLALLKQHGSKNNVAVDLFLT
jgi:hypothetical protein